MGIIQERLNLEPDVEVYPDRPAPVVRNGDSGRELVGLTWGMPSPQFVTQGKPDTHAGLPTDKLLGTRNRLSTWKLGRRTYLFPIVPPPCQHLELVSLKPSVLEGFFLAFLMKILVELTRLQSLCVFL